MNVVKLRNYLAISILLNYLVTCEISENNYENDCFEKVQSNNGSIKFINFNFDPVNKKCLSIKALQIEFQRDIVISLNVSLRSEVLRTINNRNKRKLFNYFNSHVYTECSTINHPIRICHASHHQSTQSNDSRQQVATFSGGSIIISATDGSWKRITKECTICMVTKTITNRIDNDYDNILKGGNTLFRVNLSLSNLIDQATLSAPDHLISVKFIRSLRYADGRWMLPSKLSNSSAIIHRFSIQIPQKHNTSMQEKPPDTNHNSLVGAAKSCIFSCGWISACLSKISQICDGNRDCPNGQDELNIVCDKIAIWRRKYADSEHSQKSSSFNLYGESEYVNNDIYQKPLLITGSIILLVLFTIISVLILYRYHLNQRHNHHCNHCKCDNNHNNNNHNNTTDKERGRKAITTIISGLGKKSSSCNSNIRWFNSCRSNKCQCCGNNQLTDGYISQKTLMHPKLRHSHCTNPIHKKSMNNKCNSVRVLSLPKFPVSLPSSPSEETIHNITSQSVPPKLLQTILSKDDLTLSTQVTTLDNNDDSSVLSELSDSPLDTQTHFNTTLPLSRRKQHYKYHYYHSATTNNATQNWLQTYRKSVNNSKPFSRANPRNWHIHRQRYDYSSSTLPLPSVITLPVKNYNSNYATTTSITDD